MVVPNDQELTYNQAKLNIKENFKLIDHLEKRIKEEESIKNVSIFVLKTKFNLKLYLLKKFLGIN